MNKHLLILAAALALAGSAAAQQPVYKYTDQGRTVYTDDPKAGNGKAQPVEAGQVSVTPALPQGTVSRTDRQLLDDSAKRAAALDKATGDIVVAWQALRNAQERRDKGVEPLEGERQGRRFRPEYWQRQGQLQADVAAAQAQLDDALARRNALR